MAEDSSRIQRVKNKLNKVHDKIQIRVEDFKDDLQEKYGAKSKITNFVSHMSISSEENNEIKSSKSLLSLESNDADNNTFSSSSDNIALSPSCEDFGKLKLSAKIKVLKQILSKGSLSKEESKQILNISSTELNLIEQELSTRNEKLLSDDGFDSYKKRWKSEGSDMDCKDLFAESSCDEERKLSQISDDLTSTSSSNSKRSDWPPEKEEGGGCLSPEVPPFHYPHGIHFANPADILEKLGHRFPKLKEKGDIVHRYFQRSTRLCDVNKRLKCQIWSSVVTIVLVEAKGLTAMDQDTGSSDPYCKFRLGNEKYKSKVIWRSLNPCWLEQFDLHLYDDQEQLLELTLWDRDKQSKDDFLGRCVIDLSMLEREKTHNIRQNLEDNNGEVFLLLTISGTTSSETITDLTNYQDNPRERSIIEDKFKWSRLDVWNEAGSGGVGWLCVKVFGAKGLAAADLGGKSDPFCVLELVNARLQTHTEYKTLAPNWMKIFTFNVKDISSVLEITVYDEDHDHKVEFLGKLAVPLLNITNGDKRWFSLKDKKMRARAKGNCPQILLEMTVIWNPVKACVRTLNPKEEKYMQTEIKFKRQVFLRNVIRLKSIIMWFIEIGKILQACFEWESRIRSFLALLVWIFACNYFEPWMAPFGLLLLFGRNWLIFWLTGGSYLQQPIDDEELLAEEDEDDPEQDKEEKKSLKERLQAIQEVTQSVQNSIGYMASLGEEVKNLFNFTVPYLSWLAVILLFAASFVLFLIPVRYLLMLWGINKFARKILRPHTIPNNEVLDLLSRVPDDEDLLDFRELKTHPTNDARREVRKKHKAS